MQLSVKCLVLFLFKLCSDGILLLLCYLQIGSLELLCNVRRLEVAFRMLWLKNLCEILLPPDIIDLLCMRGGYGRERGEASRSKREHAEQGQIVHGKSCLRFRLTLRPLKFPPFLELDLDFPI